MEPAFGEISDQELILRLRNTASIWFKNTDLLLLEEFIRRYLQCQLYPNTKATTIPNS